MNEFTHMFAATAGMLSPFVLCWFAWVLGIVAVESVQAARTNAMYRVQEGMRRPPFSRIAIYQVPNRSMVGLLFYGRDGNVIIAGDSHADLPPWLKRTDTQVLGPFARAATTPEAT